MSAAKIKHDEKMNIASNVDVFCVVNVNFLSTEDYECALIWLKFILLLMYNSDLAHFSEYSHKKNLVSCHIHKGN